jgi:hypothetical protein
MRRSWASRSSPPLEDEGDRLGDHPHFKIPHNLGLGDLGAGLVDAKPGDILAEEALDVDPRLGPAG